MPGTSGGIASAGHSSRSREATRSWIRRTAPVVAVVVAFSVGTLASAATPPNGLSADGRALWNFEALLHDTFGNRYVCTKGNSLNFIAPTNQCSPLATYEPYLYEFRNARHSAFHLVSRKPRGSFGNYPQPVRINGRYIACDLSGRTYLMEYSDAATFTVGCLARLP